MAKSNKKSLLQETFETIKAKVFDLNNEFINASEELVEGTLSTGEKWQKILQKSLKKGMVLFEKQQEMTLDNLEALVKQYKKGDLRFRKLFDLEDFSFVEMFKEMEEDLSGMANNASKMATSTSKRLAKRAIATVQETIAPVADAADEAIDSVKSATNAIVGKTATTAKETAKKAETTAKKTVAKAKTTAAKTQKAVAKTTKSATKKVTKAAKSVKSTAKVGKSTPATKRTATTKKTAAKATTKTVKPAAAKTTKVVKKAVAKTTTPKPVAKKAPAKKVTTKKVVAAKNELTKIEGIGPKISEILNKAGIITFDQLAKKQPAEVKEILLAAGSRYKMHNPATWGQQATLAAAGKWEELKTLQAQLKGGK